MNYKLTKLCLAFLMLFSGFSQRELQAEETEVPQRNEEINETIIKEEESTGKEETNGTMIEEGELDETHYTITDTGLTLSDLQNMITQQDEGIHAAADFSQLHRIKRVARFYSGKGTAEGYEFASMFTLDGRIAYCIEPLVLVNIDGGIGPSYTQSMDFYKFPWDTKQILLRIMWYGYGNPLTGTSDEAWLATQLLIWQITDPDNYSMIVNSLEWCSDSACSAVGGSADVSWKMNEIMNLVNNRNTTPSFASQWNGTTTYELDWDETLVLTDDGSSNLYSSAPVLDWFNDTPNESHEGINIKKEGNKLYIDIDSLYYAGYNQENGKTLTFSRKQELFDNALAGNMIWVSGDNQRVMTASGYDPTPIFSLSFKLKTSDIEIEKQDEYYLTGNFTAGTKYSLAWTEDPQSQYENDEAWKELYDQETGLKQDEYGDFFYPILNEDGTIREFEVEEDGILHINGLLPQNKTWWIKEVEASNPYQLDARVWKIDTPKQGETNHQTFVNLLRDVELNVVKKDSETSEKINDAEFVIYEIGTEEAPMDLDKEETLTGNLEGFQLEKLPSISYEELIENVQEPFVGASFSLDGYIYTVQEEDEESITLSVVRINEDELTYEMLPESVKNGTQSEFEWNGKNYTVKGKTASKIKLKAVIGEEININTESTPFNLNDVLEALKIEADEPQTLEELKTGDIIRLNDTEYTITAIEKTQEDGNKEEADMVKQITVIQTETLIIAISEEENNPIVQVTKPQEVIWQDYERDGKACLEGEKFVLERTQTEYEVISINDENTVVLQNTSSKEYFVVSKEEKEDTYETETLYFIEQGAVVDLKEILPVPSEKTVEYILSNTAHAEASGGVLSAKAVSCFTIQVVGTDEPQPVSMKQVKEAFEVWKQDALKKSENEEEKEEIEEKEFYEEEDSFEIDEIEYTIDEIVFDEDEETIKYLIITKDNDLDPSKKEEYTVYADKNEAKKNAYTGYEFGTYRIIITESNNGAGTIKKVDALPMAKITTGKNSLRIVDQTNHNVPVSGYDTKIYQDPDGLYLVKEAVSDEYGMVDTDDLEAGIYYYDGVGGTKEFTVYDKQYLDGNAKVSDLKWGRKYMACEVKLPDGYDYDGEVCFEITTDYKSGTNTTNTVVNNQLRRIDVKVVKVDQDDITYRLNGAYFTVRDVSDEGVNKVEKEAEEQKGQLSYQDLPDEFEVGDEFIKEYHEGYRRSYKIQEIEYYDLGIELEEIEKSIKAVIVYDTEDDSKTPIVLKAQDYTQTPMLGSAEEIGTYVSGAIYIQRTEEQQIEKILWQDVLEQLGNDTDVNTTNIQEGAVLKTENDEYIIQKIYVNPQGTIYAVKASSKTSEVWLYEGQEATMEEMPVEGIVYEIAEDEEFNKIIQTAMTDENGEIAVWKDAEGNILNGIYYVREENSDEVICFEVEAGTITLPEVKYGHAIEVCETRSPLGYIVGNQACEVIVPTAEYQEITFTNIRKNAKIIKRIKYMGDE